MTEAIIKAYGKINLVLDVLKKRSDGFHQVEMLMQAISLHDTLHLKVGQGIKIDCSNPFVPRDENNLAFKAAKLIIDRYQSIPGVDIYIDKNIPVEAGLAGGSTDAAAVILGMDKLFSLGMAKGEMQAIGAEIGSDVPFCLVGPTAIARGRGELVEEVVDLPPFWLVLIKPEFGVKTKDVYQNLDINNIDQHPDINGYLKALQRADRAYLLARMENLLENSTFQLYPQVKELKSNLSSLGARHLLMSGSGPTVFALFDHQQDAENFAHRAQNYYKQVFVARTLNTIDMKERVKLR